MKTIINILISVYLISFTFNYSQVINYENVSQGILVYMTDGLAKDKNTQKVIVNDKEFKEVLEKYNIENDSINFAFPNFQAKDTLTISKTGRAIK